MKKSTNILSTIIIILFLITSFNLENNQNNGFVKSDFYVPAVFNAAGIIMDTENLTLVLEDAEVSYDIEYSIGEKTYYLNNEDVHFLKYDFLGEYIISNSNETVNAFVGLPLTEWFIDSDFTNFTIQANGSVITDYTVFEIYYDSNQTFIDIIEKSLNDSIYNIRFDLSTFLFFNLTFESDSTTILTYSYSYKHKRGPFGECEILFYMSEFHINYYIGTAKTWGHNITETIQMSVEGTQPDNWTRPCSVTQNTNTSYYLWSWDNEPVTQNIVGIKYNFEELSCPTITSTSVIISSLVLWSIIVIVLKKRK